MQETTEKIKDEVVEVLKERFFSPMYFYFILAWLVANWGFVYVMLFGGSSLFVGGVQISKIDFLFNFYKFGTLSAASSSLLHLFVVPAIFSFVAVWWLTVASEKFFEKYETFKQNKKVIQRKLEYAEKVRFVKMEREVREAESGGKDIQYEDNGEFNDSLDSDGPIDVAGVMMIPSQVLYDRDYEAYKESLNEWKNTKDIELTDKQKQKVIDEHVDDLISSHEQDAWNDRGR